MDKTIIVTVLIIIFAGFLFWGFQTGFFTNNEPNDIGPVEIPEGIVLFYGDGCPHCKTVDGFIKENKIEDKVKFTRLEVWYNKVNQKIISETAEKCGIPGDTVGVPFLYDGERCLMGSPDIINFFKAQAGIQ